MSEPDGKRNIPRPADKIDPTHRSVYETGRNVKTAKAKVTAKKRTLNDFLHAALFGPSGTSDQAG